MTAFPAGFLDQRYELSMAGVWTDISGYLLPGSGIMITRGHPDESTRTNPSSVPLIADNSAGRFCQYNPTGPFYGLIGRNTPLRISTLEGASYLRSETDQVSYASCPNAAALQITGDTEVQIDVTLGNWNSNQALCGKWVASGGQRSWALELNENGTLTWWWSPDGSTLVSATSTATVPLPPLRRQALRVTLAVATGTVTFYTAVAAANQAQLGPVLATSPAWVQLGAAVVAGANSVFAGTAAVTAGDVLSAPNGYLGYLGKVHAFRLLSGIAGTVKASPDFTAQTPGAASFADGQANTWTLAGTAEISDRKYRGHFEVTAWPPDWDPTGHNVKATITGSGVLRRLGQGNTPLKSAMYRYWTKLTGSAVPVAYWPGEDGSAAGQLASGLPGGPPMLISGSASLATSTVFPGSAALPAVGGSTWTGAVQPYPAAGTTVLRFLLSIPAAGLPQTAVLVMMTVNGTVGVGAVEYQSASGGTLEAAGIFSSGWSSTPLTGINGFTGIVSLELTNSGANMNWAFNLLPLGAGAVTASSGTAASLQTGNVTSVTVNMDPIALGATVIGHIGIQTVVTDLYTVMHGPLNAWAGEPAGVRFQRLCAEEGIAFRGVGQLSASVPMGAMSQQTLMQDLQECADADRGVIFEPRQVLGLGYRTVGSLCSQKPAVTADWNADEVSPPLTMTDDDQYTINDVTITRGTTAAAGSSSQQVQASGPLSIQPPPAGVGTYDTSATLSLADDTWPPNVANWMLHLGTVNEPRWPSITADLAKANIDPVFLYAAMDADLGDYLAMISTPVSVPPGGARQIIQGLAETLTLRGWKISWQGVPESPYEVIILDDPVFGRLDTDGSTLHASISAVATSMGVDTLAGYPVWTQAAGDFPFDILMSGERITVTNITGASGTQTFTVTRSANGVVKAQTAGTPLALYYTPILALA